MGPNLDFMKSLKSTKSKLRICLRICKCQNGRRFDSVLLSNSMKFKFCRSSGDVYLNGVERIN